MADRKTFLASLGVTSALFAAARRAGAQTAPSQEPVAVPSAPASSAPSSARTSGKASKGPSAAAVAIAATMRRFDPKLSDVDLASIAMQIDANASVGAVLNPRKRRLKNGDGPATTFAAGER